MREWMMKASKTHHLYVIALGSNRPLTRWLTPPAIVSAALNALESAGLTIVAKSPPVQSRPIGPSQRDYANAAAVAACTLAPPALLTLLQRVERDFGRRRARRWGSRTLDLDIILWSGGAWHGHGLTIPHSRWRERPFVIRPVQAVAPKWRDPLTGLRPAHFAMRLAKPKPVDRAFPRL